MGIASIIYAYMRTKGVDQNERKIFLRKHLMYVIFFIGIWVVFSFSNGIFSYCYFSNTNPKGKSNKLIYNECFAKIGSGKPIVVALFNVRSYYEQ